MTVVTQAISEKKQQKEPLVTSEVLPESVTDVEGGSSSSSNQRRHAALLVQIQRNRALQAHSLTTTCIFLLALTVFTAGVFASFYVYQSYTQYKMQHFKGWCGVPLMTDMADGNEPESERLQSLMDRMQALTDPLAMDTNQGLSPKGYLEEEFDIDLEFEAYEKIEVPDFSDGRKGRFVHDFALNKTAIIDIDGGRCFIMDLNRSRILPPRTLVEMIGKINNGYYDVDTEVVRESYRVVTPPLDKIDEQDLGIYIIRECISFPIYRLEKMTVFKRSISTSGGKTLFREFAGKNIAEFHIVNLDKIPGHTGK